MKNLSVNKSLYTEYLKKRKFLSKLHLASFRKNFILDPIITCIVNCDIQYCETLQFLSRVKEI